MRLNKLLCLSAMVLALGVQAQDLKILVNKKGKIGFADQSGNEVIKCQYESAQPFSNGVAIVTKSGKSGLIDTSGNVLLPLKYTQISPWNEDLFLIKDGKKMGLANHRGKVMLPVNYSQISKPNCYGRALIALGGKAAIYAKHTYMAKAKYGVIDTQGNVLVPPNSKGLYEFSFDCDGKYPFREGKRLEYSYHYVDDTLTTDCAYLGYSGNGSNIMKAGIIDNNGKVLLKEGLYDYVMLPQNNMVRYYIAKKKQTLCGYHNLSTGKGFQATKADMPIGDMKFWSHGDFIGDIAPVSTSSWTFIDKTGKVLRSGYKSIIHSKVSKLWGAENKDEKWDVFDDFNHDVSALSGFDDILFPAHEGDKEIFSVLKEGKYGCITRSGETAIPFEYEKALGNTFDAVAVEKNGKWGFLSTQNNVIVPIEYVSLKLPAERNSKHYWVQKSDSLYYHYNAESKSISSKGYKVALNFVNGYAYVVPTDLKVEDTPINRAQIYAPHTAKATLDAIKMNEHTGAFVNIINSHDEMVFDLPVSTMYKDKVRDALEKHDTKSLTATEKKKILLDITRENRSYDLKSTLGEEEWNY